MDLLKRGQSSFLLATVEVRWKVPFALNYVSNKNRP